VISDAMQYVGKPGVWIDAVEFCRSDEGVHIAAARCPRTPPFAPRGGLLVRLSASTSFRVRQRVDNSDVLELKSRVGLTHALASLLKAFARVSRGDIRLDGVEDTTRRDP
jgi:hypothetical protein